VAHGPRLASPSRDAPRSLISIFNGRAAMATEGRGEQDHLVEAFGNKGCIDANVIGDRAWLRFDAPDNLWKVPSRASSPAHLDRLAGSSGGLLYSSLSLSLCPSQPAFLSSLAGRGLRTGTRVLVHFSFIFQPRLGFTNHYSSVLFSLMRRPKWRNKWHDCFKFCGALYCKEKPFLKGD
jgi:hypothetical protein